MSGEPRTRESTPPAGAAGQAPHGPTGGGRRRISTRTLVVAGIVVSLLLAGVVSYYASNHPDGLMFVAGEKGFLGTGTGHATDGSPFAHYATRGVGNARLSGGIAGVVGVLVVGLVAGGLFAVLRRREHDRHGD